MTRTCPLGHTCGECIWQVQLRGKDPTSEQEIDKVDCAIAVLPILLIENSQQAHQANAAIEETRNAVLHSGDQLATVIAKAAATASTQLRPLPGAGGAVLLEEFDNG